MSYSTLPKELVSLIHHVELNQSGWWDSAAEHLVLYAIWNANPCSRKELAHNLRQVGAHLNTNKVDNILEIMIKRGHVIPIDSKFKLSEEILKTFESKISRGEETESEAKRAFCGIVSTKCPGIDAAESWKAFNEIFLAPYIKEVGANAFNYILAKPIDVDSKNFVEYLGRHKQEYRASLREGIDLFFKSDNPAIKDYILRSMNAYFFVEASGLSAENLDRIERLRNSPVDFDILLDTNFIFSILGIHDNPANDAAQSVISLLQKLQPRVKSQLLVLPTTIDETKHSLNNAKESLKSFRPSKSLAIAGLDAGAGGLIAKYLESFKTTGISVNDYFNRFANNLISLLRASGVNMVNENVDAFKSDLQVLDDHQHRMRDESTLPPAKRRGSQRWMHDIILWHYAKSKRSQRIDSPMEAKIWIVTVDHVFLKWDIFKSTKLTADIQNCLHPTSLLQLLQFWLPRNAEFEQAMMNTLRLPFLFYEYDIAAEQITVRIMKKISHYENAENLSDKAMLAIIENEAVRQKIAENDDESVEKTIREVLVTELGRKETELRFVTNRADDLIEAAADKDRRLILLQDEVNALKQMIDQMRLEFVSNKAKKASPISRLREFFTALFS